MIIAIAMVVVANYNYNVVYILCLNFKNSDQLHSKAISFMIIIITNLVMINTAIKGYLTKKKTTRTFQKKHANFKLSKLIKVIKTNKRLSFLDQLSYHYYHSRIYLLTLALLLKLMKIGGR